MLKFFEEIIEILPEASAISFILFMIHHLSLLEVDQTSHRNSSCSEKCGTIQHLSTSLLVEIFEGGETVRGDTVEPGLSAHIGT